MIIDVNQTKTHTLSDENCHFHQTSIHFILAIPIEYLYHLTSNFQHIFFQHDKDLFKSCYNLNYRWPLWSKVISNGNEWWDERRMNPKNVQLLQNGYTPLSNKYLSKSFDHWMYPLIQTNKKTLLWGEGNPMRLLKMEAREKSLNYVKDTFEKEYHEFI